jgi:hypothetical protein
MRNRGSALFFVALLAGLWAPLQPAHAWESDVHYGLTKWLALQAGYTEQQADWIAEADEQVDHSRSTDPVSTTFFSACVGSDKDTTASGLVHDFHFPSEYTVPDGPKNRIVKPGVVYQRGKQQTPPKISDYTKESQFRLLGEYLHVFQDSWSHQGEPDFPQPPCNPRLGWGHAFVRGGWSCHLADLTFFWADKGNDALVVAKATYETLLQQKPGSAKYWNDLEPLVKTFAAARTKWEKDAWFQSQHIANRDFLQEISLPDCETGSQCKGVYPFQRLIDDWKQLNRPNVIQPPVGVTPVSIPVDITNLFRDFINGLVNQGGGLPSRFIDRGLANAALWRAVHGVGACPLFDKIAYSMLGSGFLDGSGARQPLELCELAFQVAKSGKAGLSCDEAMAAVGSAAPVQAGPGFQRLAEAAAAQGLPSYLMTTAYAAQSESYVAFVRFIHLPREVLLLTARRINGEGKIIGVVWAPDE